MPTVPGFLPIRQRHLPATGNGANPKRKDIGAKLLKSFLENSKGRPNPFKSEMGLVTVFSLSLLSFIVPTLPFPKYCRVDVVADQYFFIGVRERLALATAT